MTADKGVVAAFVWKGKSADASFSALRAESLAPAGEQLVGVCLMPYVKYETVARSVEYIMYCHNQVHRTHTRTEMPWVLRQIIYKIFTYLPAELRQLLHAQPAQIGRTVERRQQ